MWISFFQLTAARFKFDSGEWFVIHACGSAFWNHFLLFCSGIPVVEKWMEKQLCFSQYMHCMHTYMYIYSIYVCICICIFWKIPIPIKPLNNSKHELIKLQNSNHWWTWWERSLNVDPANANHMCLVHRSDNKITSALLPVICDWSWHQCARWRMWDYMWPCHWYCNRGTYLLWPHRYPTVRKKDATKSSLFRCETVDIIY